MKWLKNKKIKWLDENCISINGVSFYIMKTLMDLQTIESTYQRFLLGKPRWMVEKYINLLGTITAKKIFELGVLKGGSSVFFHELFNPQKLVAIEYKEKPVNALQEYIERKQCQRILKPYYGVDQADKEKMAAILKNEFPNKDIDIVIDDASHMLDETRSSFNMIFPYVRPGGLFIIEDWSWSHAPHDIWQKPNGKWSDKPALTSLIFEIIMSCPSTPDLIDEISIDKNNVFIRRGNGNIESDNFDITKSYLTRGKEFISYL
jgi:predicted O-methyltransferase YrrM